MRQRQPDWREPQGRRGRYQTSSKCNGLQAGACHDHWGSYLRGTEGTGADCCWFGSLPRFDSKARLQHNPWLLRGLRVSVVSFCARSASSVSDLHPVVTMAGDDGAQRVLLYSVGVMQREVSKELG
jgi:hypothetical protein